MYDVGDVAELTFVFERDEAATDQASVECSVKAPDGAITTPVVDHPANGTYKVSIPLTASGAWTWRVVSPNAAEEGYIRVRPSRLP